MIKPKLLLLPVLLATAISAQAQITNVLFLEDFESGTLDPAKLVPDSPFFEGGEGDIAATVTGGVVEFMGTVIRPWWAGSTLRVVPTFEVSDSRQVAVEVERVLEAGSGTASRSALWIMDETQTRYVLFAENRGETGWSLNRKIGIAGDNPTGSGTDIVAWNDAEDGGFHTMKAVADGQNVRLYLDDRPGPTVRFPYNKLVFHIGSYARAEADFAYTQFDNLRVYSIGAATFDTTSLTATAGQTLSNVVVRIPAGLNATSPVELRIVSSAPNVAVPVGATGDTLTVTFAAGATNAQTIAIATPGGLGGAQLTLTNNIGLNAGNSLNLTVITGPGIRLEDDFAGSSLDPAKWERNDTPFEVAEGVYEVVQENGRLTISGYAIGQYWSGASVRSIPTFTATKDLPLIVEVDRVSINPLRLDEVPSTGARSSLWLATTNRGQFFMFAQNAGENGWQVNVNGTGSGTDLVAFNHLDGSTNLHRMKLVADGEGVDVYLDDQLGGRFDFPVSSGLHVELGAYTRDFDDQVSVDFDNLLVQNALPCISVGATDVTVNLGQNSETVEVIIPRLLNAGEPAAITVTSRNPSIAVPEGAVNGVLTMNFAAGATNRQYFTVRTVGLGATVFDIAAPDVCSRDSVDISVTAAPQLIVSDDFSGPELSDNWVVDPAPLVDGAASFDSGVFITNGTAAIAVTADLANWPGFTVYTADSFEASISEPAIFEIDRVKLAFTLVTGTAAKQRAGIWVTDSSRSSYVFFSEHATHDGTAGGWEYHRNLGTAGDNPATGAGVLMPAFADARFNDLGAHLLRAAANGETVKFYVDGTLGAEIPFPVSEGIVFGFGTYVAAATDIAVGTFDNARVYGASGGGEPSATLTTSTAANGDITIAWNAPGTLQSRSDFGPGSGWSNVTPAPEGNSYTIPRADQNAHRFFRLVQ